MTQTQKRIPKVGDYIRIAPWSKWYDVKIIQGKDLFVLEHTTLIAYPLNYDWEFRDTEKPVLDLTKPVQTKDGRVVRILCTDNGSVFPIVGITQFSDLPQCWNAKGIQRYGIQTAGDLVNVPEKPATISETFCLVKTAAGKVSLIRKREYTEQAFVNAKKNRRILGIKEITITEGEGM